MSDSAGECARVGNSCAIFDELFGGDSPIVRQLSAVGYLSPRELEVLECLAAGLGNRPVARRLGIAERTVKAHVASILDKLDLQTRTQAAIVGFLYGAECGSGRCRVSDAPKFDCPVRQAA